MPYGRNKLTFSKGEGHLSFCFNILIFKCNNKINCSTNAKHSNHKLILQYLLLKPMYCKTTAKFCYEKRLNKQMDFLDKFGLCSKPTNSQRWTRSAGSSLTELARICTTLNGTKSILPVEFFLLLLLWVSSRFFDRGWDVVFLPHREDRKFLLRSPYLK